MKTSNASRLVLTAALLLAGPAWAQVYKWVDAEGRVHYGERPPPAREADKLTIPLRGNDPVPRAGECYTIQCQYERMREDRLIREAAWQREMESRARVAESQRNTQTRPASPALPPYDPVYAPIVRWPVIVAPNPRPQPPPQPAEPTVRLRMP
jgi:hypothetical protein